jgi:anti-sigma factor RsiW
MTCQELVELLTDFFDGVLPADERKAILEHLGGCDDCSTYVHQLEHTVGLCAELRGPGPDPGLLEQLRAAFRDR